MLSDGTPLSVAINRIRVSLNKLLTSGANWNVRSPVPVTNGWMVKAVGSTATAMIAVVWFDSSVAVKGPGPRFVMKPGRVRNPSSSRMLNVSNAISKIGGSLISLTRMVKVWVVERLTLGNVFEPSSTKLTRTKIGPELRRLTSGARSYVKVPVGEMRG